MVKRASRSIVGTWLAGLLALLPLVVTVSLLAWLFGVVVRFVGPESFVGRQLARLGDPFIENPSLSYLVGTLLLVTAIYLLGLAVQAGLKDPLARVLDAAVRRIPLVGPLYRVADKFTGLLENKAETDIGSMSAVWCFFGGDGVAVLALAPSSEPIEIDGRKYFAVLVPTAPVPIGGGLLYVPIDWVKPAQIGMDKLTATYVSMGITPPR
jgi:uncharacterized membrane protein